MAFIWQTVEEAAVTIGVSVRTLHRRVGKGDIQTRLENGRREVLVQVPDEPAVSAAPPPPTDNPDGHKSDTPPSAVTPPDQQLSATVSDTPLAVTEDRIRRAEIAVSAFQHSINIAQQETNRARSVANVAWAITGVLLACVIAATAYTTYRVTRAQSELDHVTHDMARVSATSDRDAKEVERLRQEADTAKLQAARAEGELRIMRMQQAQITVRTTPATQPSFFGRLADLLAGDR